MYICVNCSGQTPSVNASLKTTTDLRKVLVPTGSFIENIGQYGQTMKGHEAMGSILYGYEGMGMPVLFTPKGLVHLQRKIKKLSHEEEERLEKQGVKEEEIERKRDITDRTITMEWLGSNPGVKIIAEDKTFDYHTYGMLPYKAYGYKKITYHNIYPGIDLVYNFTSNVKVGFEYNLIAQPGADVSVVKLKYGGDVKTIKTDHKGNLLINSDIEGISTTAPVSYYGNRLMNKNTGGLKTAYKIENNEISFYFPNGYDNTKAFVIDPIVSTANLTGINAGKAIDVDYDYAGNIYVAGGGNLVSNFSAGASHKHAKYASDGTLLWTFNGILTIPAWQADFYYGGWVVDKATGNVYIGQGYATAGFRVIRLSTTGLYDNYISTGIPAFQEAWKMYWVCNNGTPQIICAGGGTTGPTNFAYCTPPSTVLSAAVNLTGSPVVGQDMTDLVIDPVTNSLYTIYASPLDPNTSNKIYKHNQPYSAATTVWSTFTGYPTVINELRNRPYLAPTYNDNSSNILALNPTYIFYWDGLNLKAFNKNTGAVAGAPLTIAGNTVLMQGGIVADACDNVFIGNTNGTIKVYKFNGATFDDAAAADISIAGYGAASVYDLALDESKKLLYASGDGFVASFDVSAYCPTTQYTVNVVPNCVTASATATISPAPPPNSTVTYALFIGITQIGSSNTTGVFTGLKPNVNYTIIATVNFACSGVQAKANFTLPAPVITFTQTNTTCGASTGSITATGSVTPGPYSYKLDGGTFQPSGNFTGLAAGVHTLVVQGGGGCPNDTTIIILNSDGPALTYNQTNATCGSNTGTVTANVAGGTPPYQYSIDGGTTYQAGTFFTGLVAGQYTLVVKDAANCTNSAIVTITTSPAVFLTAIPASATCGQNNGTITAFGTGGTAPLQYSINGNTFQAGNTFNDITPGTYTVYVKDAIGCIQTVTVTVGNVPAPTVTATFIGSTCNNINGSITATGSNGVAPYQYSINGGINYQTGNVFTGLAPGVYTITIKDATGCINTVSVNLTNTNGPSVTAVTTNSSCAGPTGSIAITGSGGTAPYTYSINGINFVATNNFNTLPPGNYVAYVKDNTGCIAAVPAVVGAATGPSISASATPASCLVNDGTITAIGTGGTLPLQYSINGTNYFLTNTFPGLAPGLYTVYVKDNAGCTKTTTVIVASSSGLTLTASTITSSCSTNNGTITATATGGAAPLQYSINGVTYQLSNIFTGLAPGTYTVYVKDNNGCIVTRQAIITAASGLSFTLNVLENATCGTANGVIKVNAAGGVHPLTYNIDGGAFQLTPIFTSAAAGTHTIIVKDATGCAAPAQSVTITNSGTGTAITDVTFTTVGFLACTGEGRIKNLKGFPTGGGANYEFKLDDGSIFPYQTGNSFRPVSAGYHTVTARRVGSVCTISKVVLIGLDVPATATATSAASACGQSTGTITLTGVGVNKPYHASIDNGITWITFDPTTTFAGLAPATYRIIIADDADFSDATDPGVCLTTIFVTVPSTGGPSIATTQVNPDCTSNTGSITATGSGGTGPYTYSIDGGPYTSTNIFTGLTAGVHAVSVKDATGCANGVNITLPPSSVPTVTANVSGTSCGLINGSIAATGTGGTAPLEYSINGTVFQTSNSFTGLRPGPYTLYVRDANLCFSSITVVIANTPLPKVTAFTIAATCNNSDGSIVAEGSFGETPYTFSINGTAYQSSNRFENLAAGFYTVYIKDARGCVTTTGVTVPNIGAPTFTANPTTAKCGNANGSIAVNASGGTLPYQYSSDGGVSFQAGNVFSSLASGTYAVVVKDANGCTASGGVLVAEINGPQAITTAIVHAACGNADGTITVTATGGTAPFQYSRDGVTYQGSVVFTGVPAGNYTVYVKDNNGCIKSLPVTVLNLPAPTLTATASPASCGLSDGTITAVATGGTLPLQYSRNGTTFQPGNIFTGLPTGPITITVRDARNCVATFNVTVSTIGGQVTPTFTQIGPLCQNGTAPALPLTSTNGITGTWNPATISTSIVGTSNYIFTPAAGQCATPFTLPITITAGITPVFTPIGAICQNAIAPPLPLTSNNGIAGTWNPATISTTIAGTTGYTFTPNAGQCASATTMSIVVTASITPAFTQIGPLCQNATAPALPVTSTNGITGIWNPATISTTTTGTTVYTFTPNAGQCATTATLSIAVNPILSPTINCGVSTTSSVTFTWAAITGATDYTVSYQVGANPLVNIGAIGNVLTYSVSGLTAGDNVVITITPTGAAGTCFASATKTCTATACTPPTATISYAGPFCNNNTTPQPVVLTGTGTFTGGTYSAPAGLSINATTGTITPGASTAGIYTVTYTIVPGGGCPGVTATTSVTIEAVVTPSFTQVVPLCQNATAPALPLTSNNGVTGSWSPATINTTTSGTTVYTFTPNAGQCATTTTMSIVITASVTPTFTQIGPLCQNSTAPALPTTSTNGITGTWSPATIGTTTTGTVTYTFTPTAGQCVMIGTLDITVNPILSPTINCGVSTTSGVIFNWAAVTGATGYTVSYQINALPPVPIGAIGNLLTYQVTGLLPGDNVTITVIPTGGAGTCFSTATKTCTAIACTPATASISYATPFCASDVTPQTVTLTGTGTFTGGAFSATAGLSINSTTGTIIPSTSTPGTYIVTYTLAASGGCAAVNATTTVTINAAIVPAFTQIGPLCQNTTAPVLPTTSTNNITGTWNPATISTSTAGTTVYTFTPNAGQCATTTTQSIAVNPILSATINCGVSTSSSVTFTWAAVAGASNYTVSYQIGTNPVVNVGAVGNVFTYTVGAGVSAGDNVVITVTPTGGANTCFTSATKACTATACTPPTVAISYAGSPFCANTTAPQLATLTGTGTFTGGTYSASPAGLGINAATGAITPSTSTPGTYSVAYTIAPGGGCPAVTAPTQVTIIASVTPTFTPIGPLCQNATALALPLTSTNGIAGTWNPATISTASIGTVTYAFIPNAGQCAANTTMDIVVTTSITPTFTQIGPLCQNSTAPTLPITSTNNITGTWNPSTISTATIGTTVYTFTPNAGQCAVIGSLSITIFPLPVAPTVNTTQPTCAISTGAILITSATAGLTFSLDGAVYAVYPSGGYTGLATGSHTLTAQNSSGCISAITNVTINAVPAQPAVTATTTNANCGNANGSITASGTNGTAPYQYSLDGISFQAGNVFTGLAAGAYTVTIKDANNCTNTTAVVISIFNGLTVTTISIPASCNNNDGNITATGVGGTAPYRYSIDGVNFQTSNVFSGLSANTYTVTIKDAKNCSNIATAIISINNAIELNAGSDLTICEGSSVRLAATSNASNFLWTPATGLSNPAILDPVATPAVTTSYYITATRGVCTKKDTVIILVNPAPIANAGNDTTICFGTRIRLNGKGGTTYHWSPSTYLSNPDIPNPVLAPPISKALVYYLEVVDAKGCKSFKKDSVIITVLPPVKVFAGKDTSVTINQSLLLNAIDVGNNGFVSYTWSPSFGLSNATIQNPLATFDKIGIYKYIVTARNAIGCETTDDISIKVFIGPDIHVPNAFTPNNDGANDVLKPILAGIKELKYFSVYNRFGQLMFTTSQEGAGWNGALSGQPQPAGGFVWIAEAIDYNGSTLKRKGTAILVR